MDSLLKGVFGGQDDDDDDRRRGRAQDFISRFEQGAPHEGYTDEEALHNYQQVAGRMSPQEMEEAAAETYQRMSPQDRMQLAQVMQQRAGMQFDQGAMDDPRMLARATAQYQQQDPNGLAGLFGGGGGGLGSMLGGAMGGGSSRGGGNDLLGNPLAKAAVGGIAAMAMKRMMGGR
jgi:hypothetical protein